MARSTTPPLDLRPTTTDSKRFSKSFQRVAHYNMGHHRNDTTKRCIAKPDTAGLLRWEVWRAKPSKKHLVLGVVRAAKPPEPGAKHKRLGASGPRAPAKTLTV